MCSWCYLQVSSEVPSNSFFPPKVKFIFPFKIYIFFVFDFLEFNFNYYQNRLQTYRPVNYSCWPNKLLIKPKIDPGTLLVVNVNKPANGQFLQQKMSRMFVKEVEQFLKDSGQRV